MPNDKIFWFCRNSNCPEGIQLDRESGRGDGELRCASCGGELIKGDLSWIYDAERGANEVNE